MKECKAHLFPLRRLFCCRRVAPLTLGLLALAVSNVSGQQAAGHETAVTSASVAYDCPNCQVAPWFKGEGGFVVAGSRGASRAVTVTAICGKAVASMSVQPDNAGVAAGLFTRENGMACGSNGRLEISGGRPGGWYWVWTDNGNAAVASLVPKSGLSATAVQPLDPGVAGLVVARSDHATLFENREVGVAAIVDHFLPAGDEAEVVPPCGLQTETLDDDTPMQKTDGCLLGDGRAELKLTVAGSDSPINDGRSDARIVRKRDTDTVIQLELFANGSGHISTAVTPDPLLGWDVEDGRPFVVNFWAVSLEGVPEGEADLASVGVVHASPTASTVTIVRDQAAAPCTSGRSTVVKLNIAAAVREDANAVIPVVASFPGLPPIPNGDGTRSVIPDAVQLDVHCAGGRTGQARELVPPNPFPIRRKAR